MKLIYVTNILKVSKYYMIAGMQYVLNDSKLIWKLKMISNDSIIIELS